MAGLASLISRRLARTRTGGSRRGFGEVRRLLSPAAEQLSNAASFLQALDQAIEALAILRRRRRRSHPSGAESLQDLALLRFGLMQFIDCLEAGGGAGLPAAEQVYGGADGGLAFYGHVRTFRDQLCGHQARLVGVSEAIAWLRRVNGRPVLQGVATRSRRPDRLTSVELAQITAFMEQARTAWARRVEDLRANLMDEVRALDAQQLDQLPLADE